MVGLAEGDLDPDLPVEMVSCGLPFHCIPIRSLHTIRRAVLDLAAWRRLLAGLWAANVYLLTRETEGDEVDVHVRMFGPSVGVPEDPATGSAAAALGGYLSAVDGSPSASLRWTVEQGLEIGRPSLIHVEADRRESTTTAVRVGGSALFVTEGTMRVPG